jgi:hypothetical protein
MIKKTTIKTGKGDKLASKSATMKRTKQRLVHLVGWREWVQLPKLHIDHIKAKIDTGAKTSTLHAINIKPFMQHGVYKVRFLIHPLQQDESVEVACSAEVVDIRTIIDSGGKRERRYVIKTPIIVGNEKFEIELTLTDRAGMAYRMLLGRSALKKRFMVNPYRSFLQGKGTILES